MRTCAKCGRDAPPGALVCEHDGAALTAGEEETAPAPATNELLASGATVGEYRIVELLGEGGFGAVYRAEHPVIGKSAAVKVVKREYSSNPEMTRRFVAEARAVNQIRHRNIIDIFNFGTLEDGRQYYVMELLDGCTLDALISERGRLAFDEVQPIVRQLARALAAAHGAGIAHRDLKPENVFVAFDDDGNPVPKLLDFGLAKLLGEGTGLHRTRSGVPMGTPLYMSPEQVYGKDVDHRTDVYAFGVMVFQMLTGELPFLGESVMEVMVKQTSAARPRASKACADVPSELDLPIQRMMAKDPADRPATILEALDELFEGAKAAGIAVSGSGLARMPEPSRRVEPRTSSAPKAKSGGGRPVSSGSGEVAPRAAPASSTSGLANEDTIADPRLRLVEEPAKGSRTLVVVGAAAALIVAAFFAQKQLAVAPLPGTGSATPRAAATDVPSSAPPLPPESTEPGPDALPSGAAPPGAAPSGAGAAVAPEPTRVRLTVLATPSDAEVWVGDRRLGLASESLELPSGDAPIEVELRKKGHVTQSKRVVPSGDVKFELTLPPAPKAAPATSRAGAPASSKPEVEF